MINKHLRKKLNKTALNTHLDFPYVGQAFAIERHVTHKKTGKVSTEIIYGITSQSEQDAKPESVLRTNRNHWCIENSCHYIPDWNYDEDRCRIRTQYDPENITRLRRLAISIIKTVSLKSVAETMRDLVMDIRRVFDYLRWTKNSPGREVIWD